MNLTKDSECKHDWFDIFGSSRHEQYCKICKIIRVNIGFWKLTEELWK